MEDWSIENDPAPAERTDPDGDDVVAIFEGPPQGDRTCTLVPRDAGEAELMTQWLSAHEGSFVDLDEVR